MTILSLLTGQGRPELAPDILAGISSRYDTILFFLIDSFGWQFFERYRDRHPFLQHFLQAGKVAKLTSEFPSTTTVHVTTINTGLSVAQAGLYEWYIYDGQVDALIAPLLFAYAGTDRESLAASKVKPERLFPNQTLYQALRRNGVASFVFQHSEYARSTYSKAVSKDADIIPYRTLPEALVNMQQLLEGHPSPAYIYLYFDKIDTIAHTYGPNSPQVEAEIEMFLTIMDRLFRPFLSTQRKRTLVMLTADHGHCAIDPKTTIYLNRDPRFRGIEHFLATNRHGQLLVPAGGPRDMFLYVKPEQLDAAQGFLATQLSGQADVVKVDDLIRAGVFGGQDVSARFTERVGNLVILPYRNESVWWYEKGRFEQKQYGHHGGLTPEEMEIPLLMHAQ